MARYFTFGPILQGEEATLENAIEYARGYDWSLDEPAWQDIGHADHKDTVNGIEIYYDYAADYYFFCPDMEDRSPRGLGNAGLESGAASIFIDLTEATIMVKHGTEDMQLFEACNVPAGSWDKLWDVLEEIGKESEDYWREI